MKKSRHTKMKWSEIVRVDFPQFLINSRQQACHYETADGEPLAAGYYLALRPTAACSSYYGRELRYLGPFATKATARLLQTTAQELGIVDLAANSDPIAILLPPASDHRQASYPPHRPMQAATGMAHVYQGA